MSCIYCLDEPELRMNCYCRTLSVPDIIPVPEEEIDALQKIFAERKRAKQEGNLERSLTIKVLMNFGQPYVSYQQIAKGLGL